jgi:hypothetical protein
MGTNRHKRKSPVEMPTELAHRASNGIEVLLFWDRSDGRLTVVVDDVRTGGSFELVAADGRQALDAFRHPFAYAAARGVAYRTEGRPGAEAVEPEVAAFAPSQG